MTPEDYQTFLAFLEQNECKHVLMPVLRKGHSRMNGIYMNTVLKTMETTNVAIEQTPDPIDDEQLKQMRMRKSTLFGMRAKASNEFHRCTTDQQRGELSDRVLSIQSQIEGNNKNIKHYKLHGSMPTNKVGEFDIPKNPMSLVKKQLSLRANISRTKKGLEELAKLPENHPKKSKIPEKEKNLKRLQLYQEHVNKAIEDQNIHAKGV